MILTNNSKEIYKVNVNKGLFTRICKELQTRGKLKLSLSSSDDDMVASSVVKGSGSNKFVINITMSDKKIKAFFIEMGTASIRYYTDLKTYTVNSLGEVEKCSDEDMNKYIDDFVDEIIFANCSAI